MCFCRERVPGEPSVTAPRLSAPEVVLNEERGVELADSDLVVVGRTRRHDLVDELRARALPDLPDDAAQLVVRLIDRDACTHVSA